MGRSCTTAGMTAGTTRTRAVPIEASRRRKTIGAPRHQSHEPPVFCVPSIFSIAEAVARIVTRIRRDEDTYGSAGTYLYVRPDGTVYLVREEMTCAQRWVREHFDWLVGFYTRLPNPNKGLSLEAHGMAEDIAEHLQGFSAADGRECVGRQQTGAANSLQSATAAASSMRSEPAGAGDNPSAGGGRSTRSDE